MYGNPVNNGRFSISTGEFTGFLNHQAVGTILPIYGTPLTLDGLVIFTGLLPPGRLGSAPGDFLVSSKETFFFQPSRPFFQPHLFFSTLSPFFSTPPIFFGNDDDDDDHQDYYYYYYYHYHYYYYYYY